MLVVYFLVAMLGAAVAFFTLQNQEPVAVTFFHWHSARLPLSLLVLFSALAGVLLAALSGFVQQVQLHRRIHHLERMRRPPAMPVEAAPERLDHPLPRI